MFRTCHLILVHWGVDDTIDSCNNAVVGHNACNWSLLNVGCSESMFLWNLCSCNDKEAVWCFVHNTVNEKKLYCVNNNNDFGFVCNVYPPAFI